MTAKKKKMNTKKKAPTKKAATKKVAKKNPAKAPEETKPEMKKPVETQENPPAPVASKPPAGGKPTLESMIIACQCGSARYEVKKRTKTSVSLICAKCGLRCSVKGNVAQVRVGQQEVLYALAHTVITPDDTPEDSGPGVAPGEKVGDGTGGFGAKKKTWRCQLMDGDQWNVVADAMELARIMNCNSDEFREQTWQGHAFEFICADFRSGVPQDALQILEAMKASEADAKRIAAQDSKPEPTARKIRDIRANVRDKLAYESGYLTAEKMGGDARTLDLPGVDDNKGVQNEDSEAEKPEPIQDGGRLMRAVSKTLESYASDAADIGLEGSELPEFVVRQAYIPPKDLIEKWASGGGYLVRILGSDRTIDPDGERAVVCAWVSVEPAELALDFEMEYDDAVEDILTTGAVEVIELLPPDYDDIEPWDKPHFADRREKL